jgi:predicted PurR-regulated permease PerM
MARIISLVALLASIVGVGILFYWFMSSFLIPLFVAAVITVIFRPMQDWLAARFNGRQRLAAVFSTTAALLLTLLPVGVVVTMASFEGVRFARTVNSQSLNRNLIDLRERLGLSAPNAERLRSMDESLAELGADATTTPEIIAQRVEDLREDAEALRSKLDEKTLAASEPALFEFEGSLEAIPTDQPGSRNYRDTVAAATDRFQAMRTAIYGGSTMALLKTIANPSEAQLRDFFERALAEVQSSLVSFTGSAGVKLIEFVVGLVILIVATFFFFADGPYMVQGAIRLIPLDESYVRELFEEFSRVSRAVFMATVLAAAAQATTAALGYWLAGVPNLFTLTVVTFVMSMVPFFGAGSVFFTVCAYLFFVQNEPIAAALLAVYGLTIVSTVDNVIKPFILHGQSNINPLLALLSILGGVKALGPVGILVGPLVVVYLSTMLRILQRELTSMDAANRARPHDDDPRRSPRFRRAYGPSPRRRWTKQLPLKTQTP